MGIESPVVQILAGIILLVLTGLGIKKSQQHDDTELTPDTKPTRRDTILMLMTDRVHAVRNDLTPQIGKLQLEDAKMDLRITQNRDDITRLRTDLEAGFRDTNQHIDNSFEKHEKNMKDSLDRIWRQLDKEK